MPVPAALLLLERLTSPIKEHLGEDKRPFLELGAPPEEQQTVEDLTQCTSFDHVSKERFGFNAKQRGPAQSTVFTRLVVALAAIELYCLYFQLHKF